MKRTVCLFAVCLLLAACLPAVAADNLAPAPIILLSKEYNPFFTVSFPDSYSLTAVKCDWMDSLEYTLVFGTSNAMNDIIAFIAGLLPDDNVDEMRNAMNLMSSGGTEINGKINGASVRIRIADTQFGGAAEGGKRFEVEVTEIRGPEAKYGELFAANLQHPVIQEISAYIPLFPLENATLTVMPEENRAEMFICYQLDNAEQVKDTLLQTYPDYYYEPSDWLVWRIGEMQIVVTLEGAANGELGILANFASPEVSLLDYMTEKTLKKLGFEDYREPSAKCSYRNDAAGVWLSVSKSEWGENNNTAEQNAVTFMTEESGAFVIIFYKDESKTYDITIESGGAQAKYAFLAGEDRYTDAYGGDDLTNAKQVATDAFLSPGEEIDDVLPLAVMLLDSFVSDTFGCTLDELYAMEYE